MSLRSSQLISSIGRLRALHVQAAGGVLLLGPQQVVGLLADLRAGASTGRCAPSRSRCAPARPGRDAAPAGPRRRAPAARAWSDGAAARVRVRSVMAVSAWSVCAAMSGQPARRARLPCHARRLADACTRRCGLSRGRLRSAALQRRAAPSIARRHGRNAASTMDTDQVARAERSRLLGRLDRPPVPGPEVRPVRRHRIRRPHRHACTPATSC